jgi:class 3 adenylate cyclase
MEVPATRYVKNGAAHLAYQVLGDGPLDLVVVPGWVSHLELDWFVPELADFIRRLAQFSRVIRFDKRGTGLSDRVSIDAMPTLEQRMDDVRAVMDAVGSERAALFGISEGGAMSVLFAATLPERTAALILYGSHARSGLPGEDSLLSRLASDPSLAEEAEREWADGWALEYFAPCLAADQTARALWGSYLRSAASPAAAFAMIRMALNSDVTDALGAVRVPTLVLHRRGDRATSVAHGRYLADHIADARLVELEGDDHFWHMGDSEAILGEMQEFLTGERPVPYSDRVLATVLFIDIAGSTERAASIGDHAWTKLLSAHNTAVRTALRRYRGREIDTAGDGFFATFDGPARAVRCADTIRVEARSLGITVRAGLHTGEVEMAGDGVRGLAVHIGARVGAAAQPGEILVSRTVGDLVAGSGIKFEDRGIHQLKGVPGGWQLLSVVSA